MAILDDVIGVFSPGWKAARLRSRAVIQAYEAVKTTRTHKARRESRTADQLSQYGAVSLREQARYWCSYALGCDWLTWTHHHR